MTKRTYFYLAFALTIFFCCTDKQTVNTGEPKVIDSEKFLSKFDTVTFDTLAVHYNSGDEKKSKFYGEPLDSSDIIFVPENLRRSDDYTQYYACKKFSINDSRLGLLLRTPSEYESSSIYLLIFDQIKGVVTAYTQISEEWGDAGEVFSKVSWLFVDKTGPGVFTQDCYSVDNSVADVNDTTVEQKYTYTLLTLKNSRFDTIQKNDTLLKRNFVKSSH